MTAADKEAVRHLAAILVADAVGYSRMMAADEKGTLASLTRHRRELIDPTIAAFNGRIVKGTGDGFLAEFASVVDAVRCAIGLQQSMATRTVGDAPEKRVTFRMAINIGDIISQDGDIFGDGVNVAARLEPLAEAGGLCISKSVHDQIRNKVDATFADMGAHSVKNIAVPVEAFGLTAAAIAALAPSVPESAKAKPKRRLALAALVVLLLVGAGVGSWYFKNKSVQTNPAAIALDSILKVELPNTTDATRKKLVKDYFAAHQHRSMVLAPKAKARWWSADWPTADQAVTKDLERCQVFYQEPCAILAVDDDVKDKSADGTWAVVDAPKARYQGDFDPEQIPGVRATVLSRPEVSSYGTATSPKAMAYNAHGAVSVVAKATSQHLAESQALDLCNNDLSRKDADGPCFLYAIENKIVLSEHFTGPATP
jgi:class 3 adenylate cyclase